MTNSTATTNLDNLFADIETAFNAAAEQESKTRFAIANVKAEVLAELDRLDEESDEESEGEMSYRMLNPESSNPSLEESDNVGDVIQIWVASDMTTDDLEYLEDVAEVPDVSEFLTAVDCWRTNALFA